MRFESCANLSLEGTPYFSVLCIAEPFFPQKKGRSCFIGAFRRKSSDIDEKELLESDSAELFYSPDLMVSFGVPRIRRCFEESVITRGDRKTMVLAICVEAVSSSLRWVRSQNLRVEAQQVAEHFSAEASHPALKSKSVLFEITHFIGGFPLHPLCFSKRMQISLL